MTGTPPIINQYGIPNFERAHAVLVDTKDKHLPAIA